MKKLIPALMLIAGAMIFAFQCEDQVPLENLRNENCIDPSKIDPEAACYMIYDPVCGCDGKTYSNDCVATVSGVLSFTKGKCK